MNFTSEFPAGNNVVSLWKTKANNIFFLSDENPFTSRFQEAQRNIWTPNRVILLLFIFSIFIFFFSLVLVFYFHLNIWLQYLLL